MYINDLATTYEFQNSKNVYRGWCFMHLKTRLKIKVLQIVVFFCSSHLITLMKVVLLKDQFEAPLLLKVYFRK